MEEETWFLRKSIWYVNLVYKVTNYFKNNDNMG